MTTYIFNQDWEICQLDDLLCYVIGGDWGKEPDHEDENYELVACIRGAEFKNWKNDTGATAVSRKIKRSSLENRNLQPGDILIEISGGGPEQPVGRTVLITEHVLKKFDTAVVGTNFLRLARPYNQVSSKYLNYFLTYFYISGQVVHYQGGSNNLRNLKFKEYSAIEVPFASFYEQKEIADLLDKLLAKVEATQARLARIPYIIKRFRQSVLAAAVSGQLTEEWRGKNTVNQPRKEKLASVVSFLDQGWSPKCINEPVQNNQWGVIKTSAVQPGFFLKEENKTLPEELKPRTALTLLKDDILITRAGPRSRCGITCIVNDDYPNLMICDKVYRIRTNVKHLLPQYLNWCLNSPIYLSYIEELKTGISESGMNMTQSKLKGLIVDLPSVEEQTEIVRRVEQLFAYADTLEQQANAAKERVDNLTQAILAKAFRGELTADWRTANPDLISGDNSAAALLARIQAERATASGKKGKRGTSKSRTTA
ncbi:restriction endonuclease subunit S [Aeromonas caviae]|uniref:Restriction endonuclease subunit S n=1 Tax=Aeromonas caviae TaxID=648 RepID=A0AA42RAZ3_AERCA|nr:restriction endonuclease subunit S [Aeromonas caviae]MDH1505232.1 restriction endonuclease subunit S [Aeromonas caviae]MDH1803432.1 restriction endonuclease subunit S [Aeromonas caviae]